MRKLFYAWWLQHERRATTIAFAAGFIIDSLTLRRVDLWLENIAFFIYLVVAAFCIVFFNAYEGGRLMGRRGARSARYLPIAMQFAFGALLSGFFVFYSRSASLVRSWPFLVLLILLLVGNERFRDRYTRIPFQVAVFFFIAFSYAIFIVPVVLRVMGVPTFLLSGLIGLLLTWLLLRGLKWATPVRYRESRTRALQVVAAIYLTFNMLYFLRVIPPIPLALKDIGVYHTVARTASGDYRVQYETVKWYDLRARLFPIFHRKGSEPVSVLSAVFAPTKLTVPIVHMWASYDEEAGEWVESARIRFTIIGARDGGYRGYSTKANLAPGRWRVDVATARGELIGRIGFRVEEAVAPVVLAEGVR